MYRVLMVISIARLELEGCVLAVVAAATQDPPPPRLILTVTVHLSSNRVYKGFSVRP